MTLIFGIGCHMIDTRLSPAHNTTLGFGPWTVQLWDKYYYPVGSLDDQYYGDLQDDIFEQVDDKTVEFVRQTVCVSYSNWYRGIDLREELNFDAKAKTAQAFSMMAIVLSLLLLVVASLPCCCAIGQRNFVFLAFTCVFTSFASLMTLIMIDSNICRKDLGCKYGWTAWFCVAAGIVWFVTGLAMYKSSSLEPRSHPTAFVPSPPPAYEVYPAETATAVTGQLETTEETIQVPNPDGTCTVVHRSIVHNPDGSKTVTETTHVENWQ